MSELATGPVNRPRGEPVLAVDGLTAVYHDRRGTVHAVNEVSFDVRRAEIVGIVGESGCGKSATVKAVLGILGPNGRVTSGTVRYLGQKLHGMTARQLRLIRGSEISLVTQNPFGALNPILTIGRQFHNMIRAHERKTARARSRERALDMLRAVGIPEPGRVIDGYAHELSGGMAQRVVIAMALILNPKLVIADEPTTALDVTIQRQILDLVRDLCAEGDRAMLLVTHNLGVVAQYCQRIVVMYAGRVVEEGPVADVFGNPAHPYTRALLRAVPRRGQPLRGLGGSVADLTVEHSGCPFVSRCDLALERCRVEAPMLVPVAGVDSGRMGSCHRAEEVLAGVDGPGTAAQ